MSEHPTRRLVERYIEAYRSGDVSELSRIVTDDFVDHSTHAFGRGPEAVARAVALVHAGFSDIACTLVHCLCEGDSAAFHVVVEATHSGTFGPHPPTGRRVRWAAADFVHLRDGLIAELWSIQDRLALLEGVGGPLRAAPRSLGQVPGFLRNAGNRIAAASQHTEGIEGYLFDGADGSQVALWQSAEDRVSQEHAHDFDEYVLVIEGRCTVTLDGTTVELRPGDELVVAGGTRQQMAVSAGTRTLHAFGGKRAVRSLRG